MNMLRSLVIAWLQLSFGRVRLLLAVLGVVFADVLMWMQLGFMDACPNCAKVVNERLNADLVVVSHLSESTFRLSSFSARVLHRVPAHPDVVAVQAGLTGVANWRNPWDGREFTVLVYGFEPYELPLFVPELEEQWSAVRQSDVCLFDDRSRPEFGPVAETLHEGKVVQVEINHRKLNVAGAVRIGASFAADGSVVTTDSNFHRIFPSRKRGAIDLGLVRLRPGADVRLVKSQLQSLLSTDVVVLTIPELVDYELRFWEQNSPIGVMFTMGAAIGFLVGFVIVYQILHTDITSYLPQYATLKAIGFTSGYLWRLVLVEALFLALLGYIPGTAVAAGLYRLTTEATYLPMEFTGQRAVQMLVLTIAMCFFSGAMAVRKLRTADPADVM
jgi:putative ABC transport system permease protein